MPNVLLTGFEAYGSTPVNPAESVARALDGIEQRRQRLMNRPG